MTSVGSATETLSTSVGPVPTSRVDLWARRIAAGLVAAVAAYGSYEHRRAFALHGGADTTSAGLRRFSVDGPRVLAGQMTDGIATGVRLVGRYVVARGDLAGATGAVYSRW